ncbi:hypothetical protein AVEN_123116-1 [Araneus ventricosus]|uniref:Uncharacterized protein n=1 Tax=Araneus ventricosus TaxID=182803 RepID=A0A4Y2M6K2_ARAVE|nr:hypothetical protein AVEN_123116-1 [Araneus ventricosus]
MLNPHKDVCPVIGDGTVNQPPQHNLLTYMPAFHPSTRGDPFVNELFSRAESRNKTIWLIPPVHHWYQGSRPGGCLSIDCSRRDQTTLTRFLSGHIRSLTFSDNSKCFEICPKCTAEQATPDHILACLGLSKQDLVSNPLLTLDFFRVRRLMDLI